MSNSSQVCYSLTDASKKLRELVEGALQSIWIASAFIDRCGVELLRKAYARGVQVKVLTSTEVGEDILRELMEIAEVKVFKERFMHMKLYIVDGKALTGSANLTCPVLEGKNIEILCGIPLEEAVKNFNTLWLSTEEVKLPPEEIWLRVRDTPRRVIIESKIMPGLYIEIDKFLKRPVIKRDKGVEVCPQVVKEVCICDVKNYESLIDRVLEYISSYSTDLCYWIYKVYFAENLVEVVSRSISPAAFIVIGLYPMVLHMYNMKLGEELATSLNEELRKLNVDILDKCNISFEPGIDICLRLLDKPKVTIVYKFIAHHYSCPYINKDTVEMLKGSLDQALNNIKPLSEEKMKRLYEEYQKWLQSYGVKHVEIDGPLAAKIHIHAMGVTSEYEVELGLL